MKADSDFYLALSQFCTIQHQLTNAMQHYQKGNEKLRNTVSSSAILRISRLFENKVVNYVFLLRAHEWFNLETKLLNSLIWNKGIALTQYRTLIL